MRKIIPVLLLLALLLVCSGLADENGFCDPVPDTLSPLLESAPQDCLVLHAPDGTMHAYLISEGGWMLEGYRLKAGEWECVCSGVALNGCQDVYLRPDKSVFGFEVYSLSGPAETYGWDGQEYYSLIRWRDPDRYDGLVTVEDTVVSYYPSGSSKPEYEVKVGDASCLQAWLFSIDTRPATPQEARARAAILPDAVAQDFVGYTLAGYVCNDAGREADAVFARVQNGLLQIMKAGYTSEKGRVSSYSLMDIPLAAGLRDTPPETLWQDFDTLFRGSAADVLDADQLPVAGRILDLHPQGEQLVLLTADEADRRRVVIVTRDEKGDYRQAASGVLPPDTGLDTFHASDNEIQLVFENQTWSAGYRRSASGAWTLRWVMGQDMDCSVQWGRVYWTGSENGHTEGVCVGSLSGGKDLLTARFEDIPHTLAQLRGGVESAGWAVVHNPQAEDRLNLRVSPDRSAESYGKFYNGTPVRVLKTSGDWCQVQIGAKDMIGWMMRRYLAFGEATGAVEPAFPALLLREESIGLKGTAWADRARKRAVEIGLDEEWTVVGLADDLYILLNNAGDVVYAPQDWYWEGNG